MTPERPWIRVVAGVALRGDRVLAAKRPAGKPYPDRWEFPGGKVERGETDGEALRRELREELGVTAEIGDEIDSCLHKYPEKVVDLHFYRIRSMEGEPAAIGVAELRWIEPDKTEGMDFLEGDRAFLEKLRDPSRRERWFA